MDKIKWIFFCIGFLICLYGLITMQILMTVICIVVLVVWLCIIEKVIPALVVFLNNIQRIADNLEEIKIQLKPGTTGFKKQ
ncbi:MAG: hypothetical protein LUQ66_08560 [Methanoregula sp.]|nr:hypothetical protein [Methanoregula sp.]